MIIHFSDIIKYHTDISNLKQFLAQKIKNSNRAYFCGNNGISNDDLHYIFTDNKVTYSDAKDFLYNHPDLIEYIRNQYLIPNFQYINNTKICTLFNYIPVINNLYNSWLNTYNNDDNNDIIEYDPNFNNDFVNLVLKSDDFAKDELIDEIIQWARVKEKQGRIIFTQIDKTIYNNTKLIKILYNYAIKNKDKYIQSINWDKLNNGSITYNFTAFDDKSNYKYYNYIMQFCNTLKRDKNEFINQYPQYKDDINIYINNFIEFLSPEQAKNIYAAIRDTAIKINTNTVNKDRAKFLEEYPDDDKIRVENLITIDYFPQQDYMRDKPIVLKRKYNKNGTYKDYVLIGDYGTSHITVMQKPENIYLFKDEVNDMDELEEKYRSNSFITFGYLLGKIAFIYEDNLGDFNSIDEICDILKKNPNIIKVYSCPKRNGTITRLAKLKYKNYY